MDHYVDCWFHSEDGLRLYARDYRCRDPDRQHPATILCLSGLTRNCADFADLAEHLCERYRVVAVDQRGRGRSEYDADASRYSVVSYVRDMFTLLDTLQLREVILIGTSMGGLISLLMANNQPGRVLAMIINDIGPELNPRGLARIRNYVGKARPVASWAEAVAQVREINGPAFPDFSEQQWLDFARGMYREEDGVPVLAYDPAIAQPLVQEGSTGLPQDFWPVFDTLLEIPMLVVRGVQSDILAASCVRDMMIRKPDLQVAEIPQRGHAPTLTEPAALVAVDAFLGQHETWLDRRGTTPGVDSHEYG